MKSPLVCLLALACAFGLGRLTAQRDPALPLLDADRAFDAATATGGAKAWASFFAEDGKMFRGNGTITQGRPAIEALMKPFLSQPGTTLRWKPTFADVASSQDLGYTTGESITRTKDEKGQMLEGTGRYVTIWKKQRDGSWKAALDIGTGAPPKPVK